MKKIYKLQTLAWIVLIIAVFATLLGRDWEYVEYIGLIALSLWCIAMWLGFKAGTEYAKLENNKEE